MDEFIGNKVDANGNLTREYREWLLGKKDRVELSRQAREDVRPRDLTKEEHDKLVTSDLSLEDKDAISKDIRSINPVAVEASQSPVVERNREPMSISTSKKAIIPTPSEIPLSSTPTQKYYNEESSKPWSVPSTFDLETDLDELASKEAKEVRTDTPTQKYYNEESSKPWTQPEPEEGWLDKVSKLVNTVGNPNNPIAMRLMDAIVKAGGALGSMEGKGGAKYEESKPAFYETSKAIQSDQLEADKVASDKARAASEQAQLDRRNSMEDKAAKLREEELQRKLEETNSKVDPTSPRNVAMRNALLNVRPDLKGRLDGLGYDDMLKIYDNLNELEKQKASEAYKNDTLAIKREMAELSASMRLSQQEAAARRAEDSASMAAQRLDLARQKFEFDKSKPQAGQEPSATQSAAAGYAKRLEQSEEVFNEIDKQGFDRSGISGGVQSYLPNVANKLWLKSEDSIRQEQAERNFINSVLRRESGAAIAPSEFESAEKQYFPRVGDTPAVIEQKRRNRQQVIESLKAESSKAYDKSGYVSQSTNQDRVKVKSPEGKVGSIPRAQLPYAIRDGYTEVKE